MKDDRQQTIKRMYGEVGEKYKSSSCKKNNFK